MGADGVVRIVFCLMLAAIGVKAVGWYGLAVAVAPLVGVLAVGSRGQLRTEAARRPRGPRSPRTSAGCCSAR